MFNKYINCVFVNTQLLISFNKYAKQRNEAKWIYTDDDDK